jgi:chromosome condensin MukBEF MukE localization factor
MYTEAKMRAYTQWLERLTDPEIPMDAQERYDELLKLADDYRCRGIINMSERNTLIEIATAAYTRSVANLST